MDMALDLLFLGGLALSAMGCGRAALRGIGWSAADRRDTWALALPLGLGLIGLLVLGLGQIGWLDRASLAWSAIGIGALAAREVWIVARGRSGAPIGEGRVDRSQFLPLSVVTVISLSTLLCALAPVTDGDALCYHLQVPKIFLERGRYVFEPDLHETIYPLLTESLFAVALALRGPVACRLISWLLGVSLGLSVAGLAGRWLGNRSIWASAMVLATPAISNGMGAPLNDVALAAWCNAALLACVIWWERPSAAHALIAGALAGLALGAKYPALVWAALLGLLMTTIALRARWRRSSPGEAPFQRPSLSHVMLFAIVCLGIGGAWYLRAYLATGNPVFPFFKAVFGGSGLDVVLEPAKRPLPVTLWNLLTALVPMTLAPDRFDSLSHQFGPLFLMLLPGLVLLRPPRRLMVVVVALGFGFFVLCLTQRQSMRFVLAAIGPWAVGAAWVAARIAARPSRAARLAWIVIAAGLLGGSGLALARVRHGLPVLLGRETAEAFLARREPTSVVGRWIAANLPTSARIVGQEHRGYYLPRPYTMELAHRRRTGLGQAGEPPEHVVATLAQSGFTHLLLCPPVPEDAVEFDPTLSRLLAGWLADRVPVYHALLSDGDGVRRDYALYELPVDVARADREEARR